MSKDTIALKKGGSFLLEESPPEDVFAPEDFSEEQTMIRDMTEQFVADEVLPQQEQIEHKDWNVTVSLLKRCGELGLLGIEVPQKYGGENLDKVSAMIVVGETWPRCVVCRDLWRSCGNRNAAHRLFRDGRTQARLPSPALQSRKDFSLRPVRSRWRF